MRIRYGGYVCSGWFRALRRIATTCSVCSGRNIDVVREGVIIPQIVQSVRSVTLVLSPLTPFLSLLTLLTPVFDPSCPQLSSFLSSSCPVVVQLTRT
jgi:hypothetical protein